MLSLFPAVDAVESDVSAVGNLYGVWSCRCVDVRNHVSVHAAKPLRCQGGAGSLSICAGFVILSAFGRAFLYGLLPARDLLPSFPTDVPCA